jgi:hypothetical protein
MAIYTSHYSLSMTDSRLVNNNMLDNLWSIQHHLWQAKTLLIKIISEHIYIDNKLSNMLLLSKVGGYTMKLLL